MYLVYKLLLRCKTGQFQYSTKPALWSMLIQKGPFRFSIKEILNAELLPIVLRADSSSAHRPFIYTLASRPWREYFSLSQFAYNFLNTHKPAGQSDVRGFCLESGDICLQMRRFLSSHSDVSADRTFQERNGSYCNGCSFWGAAMALSQEGSRGKLEIYNLVCG